MADITVYYGPNVEVKVVQGVPPADQSAAIADLTAKLATMTTERDGLKAKLAKIVAAVNA